MKDIDIASVYTIFGFLFLFCILFYFWNSSQNDEIKTLKAENLEILETQLSILKEVRDNKKAVKVLLYSQELLIDKIDSLKIKE